MLPVYSTLPIACKHIVKKVLGKKLLQREHNLGHRQLINDIVIFSWNLGSAAICQSPKSYGLKFPTSHNGQLEKNLIICEKFLK